MVGAAEANPIFAARTNPMRRYIAVPTKTQGLTDVARHVMRWDSSQHKGSKRFELRGKHCCSPRHAMGFNLRHEGSKRVV